jgi:hypothetical protein
MSGGISYLCRGRPLPPWLAAGIRRSAQGHHQLPTLEPFSSDMFGCRTMTKVVLSSVSLCFYGWMRCEEPTHGARPDHIFFLRSEILVAKL